MNARTALAAGLGTVTLASWAAIAGASVSIPNRVDTVYDNTRGLLYITTTSGKVLRYDPAANSFLSPWSIGVSLGGADITPDGRYLLATERTAGTSQGMIHRVDLGSGSVTNLFYPLAGEGSGSYDIVALNNGTAIFSADESGSGMSIPLRQINLNTYAISSFTVAGQAQYATRGADLWRNVTRSTVLIDDPATSAGALRIYSTATNSYRVSRDLGTYLNYLHVALSPDGSTVALDGANVDFSVEHTADLSLIALLHDADGGVVYDPTGTYLYAVSNDNYIHQYRASDYGEAGTLPTGASISMWGCWGDSAEISDDGRWLLVMAGEDLFSYALTPAPEPAAALFSFIVGAVILRRSR